MNTKKKKKRRRRGGEEEEKKKKRRRRRGGGEEEEKKKKRRRRRREEEEEEKKKRKRRRRRGRGTESKLNLRENKGQEDGQQHKEHAYADEHELPLLKPLERFATVSPRRQLAMRARQERIAIRLVLRLAGRMLLGLDLGEKAEFDVHFADRFVRIVWVHELHPLALLNGNGKILAQRAVEKRLQIVENLADGAVPEPHRLVPDRDFEAGDLAGQLDGEDHAVVPLRLSAL